MIFPYHRLNLSSTIYKNVDILGYLYHTLIHTCKTKTNKQTNKQKTYTLNSSTTFLKDSSHAYILMTRIPVMISLIILTLLSVYFTTFLLIFINSRPIIICRGASSNNKPMPARLEMPISRHTRYPLTPTRIGPIHKKCRNRAA